MANFNTYAKKLKRLEGGFVNHPLDQGGATNQGITLKTFRQFYSENMTIDNLKNLTPEQWENIIKTKYWDKCSADNINSQSVAEIMVDWCVNSGVAMIRRLQEILSVVPDGKVGPITLAAINSQDPRNLFERIKAIRAKYYHYIVERKPKQEIFLEGWLHRVNSFKFIE